MKRRSQGNLIKKMELTSPLCLSSFDPLIPFYEREKDALRVLTRIGKKRKGSFFAISTNGERTWPCSTSKQRYWKLRLYYYSTNVYSNFHFVVATLRISYSTFLDAIVVGDKTIYNSILYS